MPIKYPVTRPTIKSSFTRDTDWPAATRIALQFTKVSLIDSHETLAVH